MQVKYNFPFDDYLATEALSASQLKTFLRSPAHYKAGLETTRKDTPALRFGRLFHSYLLEPDTITLAVAPTVDRRTKDGKAAYAAFCAENTASEVVTLDEAEALNGMSRTVWDHPAAAELLGSERETELSVFWDEPVDSEFTKSLSCKARIDALTQDGWVADLKTAEDSSPAGFARACKRYGYAVQAAWYLHAARQTGIEPKGFVFVAVEKTSPWAVGVYQISKIDIEAAEDRIWSALPELVRCQESGIYPAYSNEMMTLQLSIGNGWDSGDIF